MASQPPQSTSVPSGRTLEDLLRRGTPLEPAEVARIGVALGRALESAHIAGRRHSGFTMRDVLIAADGRLALASPEVEPQSAGDGASGSADVPLYAAPETLRGEPYTQQSDVYSAGVMLYRLLTGAFPVCAEAVHQGRHAEARNARADLRGSRVPLPLAQVVERAIDPKPEARHATLDALSIDLHEAARELRARDGLVLRRAPALVVALAIAAVAWVVVRSPLDRPVIAVRFQHHGGSIDARETVDGMTIEMSRLLAQAEGLEVRAAFPSLSDRHRPGDPGDAVVFGRGRRANFVLSGVVQGESGGWRVVDASLVRIRDETTVWAESFPVVDGDIFAVHDLIAEAVADALRTHFGSDRRRHSTTPLLQEVFLSARALQAAGGDAGRRAAEMFDRVVTADPEFAPASAALATTLGGIPSGSHDLPMFDPEMAGAARRAHANDPQLAEANAAMGLLSARMCQLSQAQTFFKESLKSDPSVTSTSIDYALSTLLPMRDTREALDVLASALEADPMSVRVRSALAHVLVAHGEYDRALEISRAVIEEAPDLAAARQTLGRALSLSGRAGKAGEGMTQAEDQWGYRGYILAVQGRRAEAMRLAEAHPDEPARQMLIYAGLKDVDRTVDALQRTARLNPWRALTWMARPEIELVLRGDARAASIRDHLRRSEGCGDEPASGVIRAGGPSERRP